MHGDSDGEATLSSLLVLCVTIFLFGSNFVPIKNVPIKNYAFFQWVMCNAILLTVIPWCLMQGHQVHLHPIAFIGGVAWCCGNYLCPMILDKLGLGVGSLLWGTVEMFVAWLSGTFGILGVERQTIQRPWLNVFGVMIVVTGGVVLSQVSSDTSTSTIDTSEFSALSSIPMESPTRHTAEEMKHQADDEAGMEMDRIFSSTTASPCAPTVYQSNPMLDMTSTSIVSLRLSRDGAQRLVENVGGRHTTTGRELAATTCATGRGKDSSNASSSSSPVLNPVGMLAGAHQQVSVSDMHVSTPASNDSLSKSSPVPSRADTTLESPTAIYPPLHTSSSPHVTTTSTPIEPIVMPPPIDAGLFDHHHPHPHPQDDDSAHLLNHEDDVEKATTMEPPSNDAEEQTLAICWKQRPLRPYEEGVVLALVAGALFGLCFNPIQHLVDQSDGHVTAGELIVSHYVGICYTSYALLLLSLLWNHVYQVQEAQQQQPSSAVLLDVECILPAIASGMMWGIGAIAWFVAAESLPISVTFPLISAGPNLVTMTWSLVYFREVRGRRDLGLLSVALTLLGLGLFCVWFSNL